MIRVVLTIVLPLLLPTVLYVLWHLLWLAAQRRAPLRGQAAAWDTAPWLWLAVAGLVLAALMLIALNVNVGGPREGIYVPPHLRGGQVVPGRVDSMIAPRPAAGERPAASGR